MSARAGPRQSSVHEHYDRVAEVFASHGERPWEWNRGAVATDGGASAVDAISIDSFDGDDNQRGVDDDKRNTKSTNATGHVDGPSRSDDARGHGADRRRLERSSHVPRQQGGVAPGGVGKERDNPAVKL